MCNRYKNISALPYKNTSSQINNYNLVPVLCSPIRGVVSEWASLKSHSTHNRSFRTQVFPVELAGCLTDQQVWFPVDFEEKFSRKFSRICSFIDIYRAGSLTPGITRILFTQAIAQLKDIYRGLTAPISINPGLLQDVFTGTLWSTRILNQPENFQETLLISSKFPGVLDTLARQFRKTWFDSTYFRFNSPCIVNLLEKNTKWIIHS